MQRSSPRLAPMLAAAAVALAPATSLAKGPAAAVARTDGQAGFAPHAMVAAANPLAVEAGLKVLRAGGSAVDAAVAIQAVLGLVEPQSSGLGGGAFMTYRDGKTGKLTVYDGRETAPAAATPQLFYGADGKPLPFVQAVLSGRSTGVPGAIAMLALAQKEQGRRPWGTLFGEAERLAGEGFTVGPRLADAANAKWPQAQTPDSTRYFTKADGARIQRGDVLRNPAYADTIRRVAKEGPAALLKGEIARDIVSKLHEGAIPGAMTEADLAGYAPIKREALCRPFAGHVACGPPPPAGTVGVLEILGLLERTDIAKRNADDPQAWVAFAQASRLGYADRDRYVGDPAFAKVPVEGMTSAAYLDARAKLIATLGGSKVSPGTPPGAPAAGVDRTAEPGGTTHFVVVDAFGNALSMTTTVESVFGSGRMTHGFFLNNQLTDFSFTPTNADGAPAANAVAAGKRPRSSMSPMLVLDRKGGFVAAVGSPGGNSIVGYVAKAMVALLDWKLSPQAAAALPNLVGRGDVISLEKGASPAVLAALQVAGVQVRADAGEASGIHIIVKRPSGYEGGADPRREGVARGY